MKNVLFVFVVMCGIPSLVAQIFTYDLSDYVQGDVSISNNYVHPRVTFRSFSNDSDTYLNDLEEGSFYFSHMFSKFVNSEKGYSNLSTSTSLSASGGIADDSKSLSYSPNFRMDYSRNQYFTKNNFIGFRTFSSNDYNYIKYYGTINYDPFIQKRYDTYAYADIFYGFGRVQNVEDPLRAISIFRVLKENHFLLKNEISHNDIDSLSALLNTLRSLRNQKTKYVDFRLLTNASFELLSKYLIKNEMVRADDYAMFGLLYDTYRYEYFSARRTNNEFRVGLSYQYSFYRDHRSDDDNDINFDRTTKYPRIYLSYLVNKPLNILWYITGDSRISYHKIKFYNTNYDSSISYEKSNGLSLSTSWSINFQPSIRTNFYSKIELEFSKSQITTDTEPTMDEVYKSIAFSTGLQYYFSPQYILLFNLSMGISEEVAIDNYSYLFTSMNLSVNYVFR